MKTTVCEFTFLNFKSLSVNRQTLGLLHKWLYNHVLKYVLIAFLPGCVVTNIADNPLQCFWGTAFKCFDIDLPFIKYMIIKMYLTDYATNTSYIV